MRIPALLLAAGLALAATPARLPAQEADVPSREAAAEQREAAAAAEAWLRLLDEGRYRETWERAAPLFRAALTAGQWEAAVRPVRQEVGALVERQLLRAAPRSSLPNAPPGEYMMVEFDSAFENVARAVETVVLRREGEDGWKVVGSFVRPA